MRILLLFAVIAAALPAKAQEGKAPLPAVSIVPRAEWGAQPAEIAALEAHRNGAIRHLTIHHTESPTPDRLDEAARLRSIQRGHMVADHQWGDIAYHFLIGPSGKIYEGRSPAYAASSGTVYLSAAGWSAAGQNERGQTTAALPLTATGERVRAPGVTAGHLTICFVGNFEKQLPTAEAQRSMARLVASHLRAHGLTVDDVFFHREVACWSDCPGQTLYDWFRGAERKRGARGEGLRLIAAELEKLP